MKSGKLQKGRKRYGYLRKMAYSRRIPDEIIDVRNPDELLNIIVRDFFGFFYAECIKKSVKPVRLISRFGRVNDDFVNGYTTILIESKVVRIPRIVKNVIYKKFIR